MKDQKKAQEIATERVQLLSPLLAEGLDAAKARQIRAQICEISGLSERTIRRYMAQYRKEGFDGLKPKGKGHRDGGAIPDHLLEQAILLRREVPSRSVSQIIQILEWEKLAEPGQLKRSTLQEKLAEKGYSSRHMRMYSDTGVAARRFQHRARNQLWHSDIKYGPYLPIGSSGEKKQVYLVVFLDDATRFVLHAGFYPTLDQRIIEQGFREAIQSYGSPESVYFDNGKQYRTKWMKRMCSKLGIRLLYARPYSPEGAGKIERFNRVVDSFLDEVALEKPTTLNQLNERFHVWLSECYQHKPHSALDKNTSPEAAFRGDKQLLRFVDADSLTQAFLHCELRKVDKSGCISFMSKKYEVGINFIGSKVDVIYDPSDITELTIEYDGYQPWKVHELKIGERAGKRPTMPEHLGKKQVEHSRLLDAAEDQYESRMIQRKPAVSYRNVGKGDAHDV
jgi:transposase InsO family protein